MTKEDENNGGKGAKDVSQEDESDGSKVTKNEVNNSTFYENLPRSYKEYIQFYRSLWIMKRAMHTLYKYLDYRS